MDDNCSTNSDSRRKTIFYEWTRDKVMNDIMNGKTNKNKRVINKIKLKGTSNYNLNYMKTHANEIKKKINDKLPTIKLNKLGKNSIMEYSNRKQSTLSQKRSQSGVHYNIPNNLYYYEESNKNNNIIHSINNKNYYQENYFNNNEKENILEEYNKFNPINNNKPRNFRKSKSIYDKENEKFGNNRYDNINQFFNNNKNNNKKLVVIKNNQYSNYPYNRENKTSNYNPNDTIFRQTSRSILNNYYNENNQKPIKVGNRNYLSFKKNNEYNVHYKEEDYIIKNNERDFWNIVKGNEQNNKNNNDIKYIENDDKEIEEDFQYNKSFILNDKKDIKPNSHSSNNNRNAILNTSGEENNIQNDRNQENINNNAIIDDYSIIKENEDKKGGIGLQNAIEDVSFNSKENKEDNDKISNVNSINKSKFENAISNDDDKYENEFDKSIEKEIEDKCYDNFPYISVD